MIAIVVFLIVSSSVCAFDLSNWEFNVFGITHNHFREREFIPFVCGTLSSVIAHEAGHIVIGKAFGIDHFSIHFNRGVQVDSRDSEYYELSKNEKILYHSGGWISQTIVGSILTSIPSLRHTDFTLGFNTCSTISQLEYAIFKGVNKDSSDVGHLEDLNVDGDLVALCASIINGGLTYISLKKELLIIE